MKNIKVKLSNTNKRPLIFQSAMGGLLILILPALILLGNTGVDYNQQEISKFFFNNPELLAGPDHTYKLKVNENTVLDISSDWIVPKDKLKEEEFNYVSSFTYLKEIEHFRVDADRYVGIHLSSYDYLREGSAFAASGRDNFLILDRNTGVLHPALINSEPTKNRLRSEGWLFAEVSHFYICDVNNDNYMDIGIIQESIKYNSYSQLPCKWYIFDPVTKNWIDKGFSEKIWTHNLQKLKYIEIDDLTPVDDVINILSRGRSGNSGYEKYYELKNKNSKLKVYSGEGN